MNKTTVIYGVLLAVIGMSVWYQWVDTAPQPKPVASQPEKRSQPIKLQQPLPEPRWQEAPVYQALTPEEEVTYREQKERAEFAIKNTMQEYQDNLSNPEVRAQLEKVMRQQSKGYKAATLKLAKDALKKANTENETE